MEHLGESLLIISSFYMEIYLILVHFIQVVFALTSLWKQYKDQSSVKQLYLIFIFVYQLNFQQFQAILDGIKLC